MEVNSCLEKAAKFSNNFYLSSSWDYENRLNGKGLATQLWLKFSITAYSSPPIDHILCSTGSVKFSGNLESYETTDEYWYGGCLCWVIIKWFTNDEFFHSYVCWIEIIYS